MRLIKNYLMTLEKDKINIVVIVDFNSNAKLKRIRKDYFNNSNDLTNSKTYIVIDI